MLQWIILALFCITGIVFIAGLFVCIFWLGLEALSILFKILLPLILIFLFIGFIAFIFGS